MANLDPRWCGPPCANCGLPTASDEAWEADGADHDLGGDSLCWDEPQNCRRPRHDYYAEALEAREVIRKMDTWDEDLARKLADEHLRKWVK